MLGPLFGKELLETARRRRYFAARVVIGLAMFAAFWIAVRDKPTTVDWRNTAVLAVIGGEVFYQWALWCLVPLALLLPAAVSGLVAGEKENRTLETLFTTQLTNREILVGKLASRIFFAAALYASTLPIIAFAGFYGGFSYVQVLLAGLVHLCVGAVACTAAMYYSTITQKPYVALFRTLLFLAILWLGVPRLAWYFLRPYVYSQASYTALTSAVSVMDPPEQLLQIAREGLSLASESSLRQRTMAALSNGSVGFGRPGGPGIVLQGSPVASWSWRSGGSTIGPLFGLVLSHALIAVWFIWRSSRLLRKAAFPGKPPRFFRAAAKSYRGVVGGAVTFVERRRGGFGFRRLWEAETKSRRWREAWLEKVGDRNPLALRNATANVYDPERYIVTAQIVAWALVFVGLIVGLAWNPSLLFSETLYQWILNGAAGMVIASSLVLSACSVARERQYGSWEILRLADISPIRHVAAAVFGVVRLLWPLALLIAIVLGLRAYNFMAWTSSGVWIAGVAAVTLQCIAAGMLISFCTVRTGAAVGIAFGWAATLAIGAPLAFRLASDQLIAGVLLALWVVTILVRRRSPQRPLWLISLLLPLAVGLVLASNFALEPTREELRPGFAQSQFEPRRAKRRVAPVNYPQFTMGWSNSAAPQVQFALGRTDYPDQMVWTTDRQLFVVVVLASAMINLALLPVCFRATCARNE